MAGVVSAVGRLSVVATPIGNLGDLSTRAVQTLRAADIIAAEDTRHSAPLLNQCGASGRRVPLHEHNEREQVDTLVASMLAGQHVALISDAGTPLVSDPGYRLVRAAHAAGIVVSPVPGPSAAIAALSAAGLPSDRFAFEGFLPARASQRRERLRALAGEGRTLVFYESTHRIVESLDDMAHAFGGDREATLARELTKLFETVIPGTLASLQQRLHDDADQRRGELVIVVAGAAADDGAAQLAHGRRLFEMLCDELPPARAAKLAAAISGAPRKLLYRPGADK